jgi:PKD repeat protein
MIFGQCALITDNYSGQVAGSVCAPVSLNMDVRYKFMLPVDPSRVQILYVWNDGTGATTLVPSVSQGDTIFTATATHLYPPADQCSYTAEAYVVYNGVQCVSSSRQEQTFSAWARDNQNGAEIITDPVIARFCEGENIVDVRFTDNSTFNCNISVEPDKPNRITRWVQFIYGTNTIGGDRIPNVTIRDPLGNVYTMTDAAGNSLGPVAGPIIEIPIPADGPTEISWPISAPAGGLAGDIFEITLRNWNICNPYDRNPFDAIPPGDLIDGDNDPITTTALIEIITTPPLITNPSLEFCAGSPINLTLSTSGGQVDWFTDPGLTQYIHTGNSFNPTGAPTFIDNSVGGTHSFWVRENIGACGSAPSEISFQIFDTPAPLPDAGPDTMICRDEFILTGNVPVVGTGTWTTSGGAVIDNPGSPITRVHNLSQGPNLFRWTIVNGPCVAVDEVIVTRDLQPNAAAAGMDQAFCNNSTANLHANVPGSNGIGTWWVFTGGAVFSNSNNPSASVTGLPGGRTSLVWTITSQFGACLTTSDTMEILRDLPPVPVNAGPDRGVCDSLVINMEALPVGNGGRGTWSVLLGSAIVADLHEANSRVTNLSPGINQFRWTVASQFGICPGSQDMVSITQDIAPAPAFAGLDQNLCHSVSAPLGANNATVGTGTWSVVMNPGGHVPVFLSGIHSASTAVQILPGDEGIYAFAWTIVNGSCRTTDTLQVDFGLSVPPADAGPDTIVCGLSAALEGNHPGIGTGTWSLVSGPGSVSFVPGMHSRNAFAQINAGTEGTYMFEWRLTSGSCPSTTDQIQVLYKPMPGVPIATDEERCGPGTLLITSALGVNGDANRWYAMGTGGLSLHEGLSYSTPPLSSSEDYWVASYDIATGCESFRRRVWANIYQVPDLPTVTNVQHCGNSSLTLLAGAGNGAITCRWYDDETGGNLLAQGLNFTTPVLTAPVSYWVSSYNDSTGCESDRVRVRVQIDPIPDIPILRDERRCGEGSLTLNSQLGVNGTENQWYDSPTGGTLVNTQLSYTTPYLTATASYWVTTVNTNTSCESPRARVLAEIFPVPDLPAASNVTQCGQGVFNLTATPGANGTTNRWYDQITGGNLLFEGNSFQTGILTASTRFYVSSYNASSGCESSRLEVMAIVLPIPVANIIVGPSVVGVNQTSVIYSVNFHPGSTYSWSIPPGIQTLLISQNFVILEFPNLGLYNLSVTETNSLGCVGPPAFKPVEVKDDLIILDIASTQEEACVGVGLQLSVLPSGGTPSYTFLWEGDSQFLSSISVSNPVFTAPNPGSYQVSVTVTDVNGNENSDTIDISVYANPVALIDVTDTLVCSGTDLSLDAMIFGGSGVYNHYLWSGETTPLSGTDIRDPVFNTYIRGTYSLTFTVEDDHGCKGEDSINIINDSPLASFTSDAVPGCSPVHVKFTNASDNAVSYLWDFDDGSTSPLSDPEHLFTNSSNSIEYFNVNLTAVSQYGCTHSTNAYVTAYPNPELTIAAFPDEVCSPDEVLLSAIPGGFNYAWNFGDGQQENGHFNIMHPFENLTEKDTSYAVQLVSTSFFGCEDTGYVSILVHPSPAAAFSVSPLSQMMPETTVELTNDTEPGLWNYLWRFGDNTISTDRDPGSHVYPGPDEYLIYLVVSSVHCADSAWQSVEIVPHPPVAEFKPVAPGCMPLTIQFENTSSYSNTFLWEFGDGAVSNKPNPEYTYYEPGTYKIKLTAWGDGGADTYSTINDVWVLPNAYFEIAPRFVFVNDQAVHFFNLSDEGDIYFWDFGDGTGSEEMSPTHVYNSEGTYDVTLNVWTQNDCYDLYVMETAVIVEPTGKIVFPNVFRPESPIEENREFKPGVIDHVDEYHLMIFNRWGELIFETFNKDTGWDGYAGGVMSKQDVYIWKVEGKFSGGKVFVETGDVTLMH